MTTTEWAYVLTGATFGSIFGLLHCLTYLLEVPEKFRYSLFGGLGSAVIGALGGLLWAHTIGTLVVR